MVWFNYMSERNVTTTLQLVKKVWVVRILQIELQTTVNWVKERW